MSEVVELSVDHVVSEGEGEVVCVARCLAGIAKVGMLLSAAGAESTAMLRLDRIEWYGHQVEILEPVHHAKIQLSDADASAVAGGTRLVSSPSPSA